MIKEIVKDREFLSQPAEAATADDAEVGQDLTDTILSLKDDCAGLAANQIGSRKAVIAYLDENEEVHVLYNPRIKQAMKTYKAQEGCFSLDEESTVTRYETVKVVYDEIVDGALQHKQKKFTGWVAEVVQHGIDHCKGRLV